MRRFPLSDAEALLSGLIDPDDAPQELKQVAALIHAARGPGSAGELAAEDQLVHAIAAEVRRSTPFGAVAPHRGRRIIGKVLLGKVVAATAVLALGGGVAAAATDSLPPSIQRAVSHGFAHVGISLPDPAVHRPPAQPHRFLLPNSTSVAPNGHGTKKSSVADNHYGLCVAYLHPSATTRATGSKSSTSVFHRLSAAASAKDETIAGYCKGSAPSTGGLTHGGAHPSTTSTGPTGSHRHSSKQTRTQSNRPSSHPVIKAPASSKPQKQVRRTKTLGTIPLGKVRSTTSSKSVDKKASTTTTTLSGSISGNSSATSTAGSGKGDSAAHSHQ